jgi:prepilin-type N-terminal cleavage/methylation domain-containing protein
MKTTPRQHIKGYSLLEMSVVLTVVGVVIASFFSSYGLYIKNKAITETASNLDLAMDGLANYFIQNGRYPCPARLDAKRTDDDYGLPVDNATLPLVGCTTAGLFPSTVAPGTCLNGICVEESKRTIATLTPPQPRVLRGALPFRILNRPEYTAEDGYHRRLEYVVTEVLTNAATYNKDNGGISVEGVTGNKLVETADTVQFIVLSHGQDRAGAYSSEGALSEPCGTGVDAENCNTSTASTASKQAIYRMAQTNSKTDNTHFDDMVKFFSTVETPLWVMADAAQTDIRDAGVAAQVSIGGTSPFKPYDDTVTPPTGDKISLNIQTYARAEGDIHAGQICDADGKDCFSPLLLAGEEPKMNCTDPAHPLYDANKPYVTGIADGQVICAEAPGFGCSNPDEVMKGIAADGTVICKLPVIQCPAQKIEVCAPDDETLPASPPKTVIKTKMYGDSKYLEFTCSDKGVWQETHGWGVCDCKPDISVKSKPCTDNKDPEGSCWTGSIISTTTVTCKPYDKNTVEDDSACKCTDCTKAGPWDDCDADIWSPLTNKGAVPNNLPHSVGYKGKVNYTLSWKCSSPTKGARSWTYTGNTCVCDGTMDPLEETVSCSVTGCDSSGKNPSLGGQYKCSGGFTGEVDRYKNFSCVTSKYAANWTNTKNTCSCTDKVDKKTTDCPAGYSGTITQSRNFSCASNSWTAWKNDLAGSPPATCTKVRWTPQGSVSGSGKVGQQAYSACGPVNAKSTCYSPSKKGYVYYNSCSCQ